jgi:uncharacterized protein (DUF2345 family)
MKRLAIVVATIILTGGPLHAQDVRQLADEMRKMQRQILTLQSKSDSLERDVTVLRERLNAVNGFTQSGGSYVFNAAGGSVTISANTLVFESTSGLSLRAGSNVTLQSGSALSLVSKGSTSIQSNSLLDITTGSTTSIATGTAFNLTSGGNTTFQTGSALNLKSGGNASIESNSGTLTLKGRGALLQGADLTLKAGNAVFEASGSIGVRASGPLTLKGSTVTSN